MHILVEQSVVLAAVGADTPIVISPADQNKCLLCVVSAVVAIKGNFLLGLNFLIVSLYPIRVGATLMSSFLVNTALILAMSCAVIQFCASAFSAYANSSMIFGIFGSQVRAHAHRYGCWRTAVDNSKLHWPLRRCTGRLQDGTVIL
jgi:hypothetical protein